MKKQISITLIVDNTDEEGAIDDIIITLDTISDQLGWGNTEVSDTYPGGQNPVLYNFKVERI